MTPDRRRGWCPGALSPMRTGDGLLVRVRITGGRLAPAVALRLAEAARRHGNGLMDLSSRANLQIRGVGDSTLPHLLDDLADAGLLDRDAGGEAVRNVLAGPLAGIDPTARVDVSAIAAELEATLAADRDLHALPGKFGFLVDGGGVLPLDGLEADVGIVADEDGGFRLEAAGRLVGRVAPGRVVAAALGLARDFLRERAPGERRMREVAGRLGWTEAAPTGRAVTALAGFHAFDGEAGFVAAAVPFGRLSADQLGGLATLAGRHGAGLRLSPWRAVLLAPVPRRHAGTIGAIVEAMGLVVDPDDPRLTVSACPGSAGCASGQADVQKDAVAFARALAPLMGDGKDVSVHVSGCPKGCARRRPATVTLVAEAGLYGLSFHADAAAPREGELMTADAMAARLAVLARQRLGFESFEHA